METSNTIVNAYFFNVLSSFILDIFEVYCYESNSLESVYKSRVRKNAIMKFEAKFICMSVLTYMSVLIHMIGNNKIFMHCCGISIFAFTSAYSGVCQASARHLHRPQRIPWQVKHFCILNQKVVLH